MTKELRLFLLLTLIAGASSVTAQRRGGGLPSPTSNQPAAEIVVGWCQSTVGDYFSLCAGTLTGIMEGIDASNARSGTREICFPVFPVPLNDLRAIFAKYVQSHPKDLNQHTGHVFYAALLEAYPCKK